VTFPKYTATFPEHILTFGTYGDFSEASQEETEEEHDGDGAIDEGHNWEDDDAKPPMIRE
jgi:hypothetical protein